MSFPSSDNSDTEINERGLDLLNGNAMVLEREIQLLRTQLENEVNSSRELKESLAERDRRIAELESTLRDAAEKIREKIAVIQRIRAGCEADARQVAQIKALQANTLNLLDSKVWELMDVMDGVEDGVLHIYQSRRWRFANIILWIKGLFCSQAKRPFRGYWRIDTKLAEYRVWRDRYRSKNQ